MRAFFLPLALLVALSPWQPAWADSPHFDHYMLALSVTSAYCEDRPWAKRRLKQCRASALMHTPVLGLHGLWPNRVRRPHPEYCGGRESGSFCSLPSVTLPEELRSRLELAMPGTADCLERYEWAKHGTCSGLALDQYYAWSVRLQQRVGDALEKPLRRYRGQTVALTTLREAMRRVDPALARAVRFKCRVPDTADAAKRRPMLIGVELRFSVESGGMPGRPLPERRYSKGCPGESAWIDPADD